MRELQRVRNHVLADLLCAGFDHHDGLFRCHHDDIQQAGLLIRNRGVRNEFAIDHSDAYRRDRLGERQIGNERRGRGSGDSDHVRIVFAVRGKHHCDDLRFIAPRFGKQRTQWAIDHARGKNFALRRAPFALKESAGNLSRRVRVFAIVHGKWKKVPVIRPGIHASRDEHDRIAIARQNGAVRLLCNFSGLECQRSSANLYRNLIRSWS